jgi:hypothetical protein
MPVAELDGRSDDSHAVFLLLGHGAFVARVRHCSLVPLPSLSSATTARRLTRVRHLYTRPIALCVRCTRPGEAAPDGPGVRVDATDCWGRACK